MYLMKMYDNVMREVDKFKHLKSALQNNGVKNKKSNNNIGFKCCSRNP